MKCYECGKSIKKTYHSLNVGFFKDNIVCICNECWKKYMKGED